MAAGGDVLVSNVAVESPELALIDPELRARARLATVAPAETPEAADSPVDDEAVGEAIRRLGELSELDPATRPPRSAKLLSFAFATVSWTTLALVLAELQPWRL